MEVAERGRILLRLSMGAGAGGREADFESSSSLDRILVRLDGHAFPLRRTELVERCLVEFDLEGLLPGGLEAGRILSDPAGASAERLFAENPRLGEALRDTVVRIPGGTGARIECRILPDQSSGGLEAALRGLLEIPGLRIGIEREDPGSESPVETPLRDVIAKTVRARFPRAALVPGIAPAPTPLGAFRRRGAVACGFTPIVRAGGADPGEAASDADLRDAIATYYDVVAEFCTS
jgi:acetylornithine deacetylase/succinyl-diaminopimelate desuccinylase-like protein